MAVKTFEREVKKLSTEFKHLIENYDFEEYDFHSIRQTLQDYIEQTYPNYNDFFRSDYIMMLIELFAFYGEMMAYRVDMNMNEAYLSSAKDRRNIIKIADMLGYKHNRIEPAVSITKISMADGPYGADLLAKKKKQTSLDDILEKSSEIIFEPVAQPHEDYFPYKIDYLFSSIDATEFMNTLNNVFERLEDFSEVEGIKEKRVLEDNFEYYERSIFIDKIQMGFEPNTNVYVDYINSRKIFEIQSLKFNETLYFDNEDTEDAVTYDPDSLYADKVELGIEFVLKYDKGNNILDKNVYLYLPIVQGASFSRKVRIEKTVKNYSETIYEENIFNNPTLIRQYDEQENIIRTYYEVEHLNNTHHKFAYEVNNTPEGHIEIIFGDGKNTEVLLPAAETVLFYRKNPMNTDELYNVKNADLSNVVLTIPYYDANISQMQETVMNLPTLENFNAVGGTSADTDEQIKYMARKIRSVQDRFVTAKDYESGGMLHPRVKYTTAVLRTYIGKNSARISNDFIDIDFNSQKINIETFRIVDPIDETQSDIYIQVPAAFFTKSSIAGKNDSIRFIETDEEYFIEIFDLDEIIPNEWFRYPSEMLDSNSKGTTVKLVNRFVGDALKKRLTNVAKLNAILPLENVIKDVEFTGSSVRNLNFQINLHEDLDPLKVTADFTEQKDEILFEIDALVDEYTITSIHLIDNVDGYTMNLKYKTNEIVIPEDDLSFVWTHYRSDDIYLNPSKANIIELYVTAVKKDLRKGISIFEPLTSSEINKLVMEIDKRRMVSDNVMVYNSSAYEVTTAIRVFKDKKSAITGELLRSRVDAELDKFYDIENIPLGKHFYMSRLIEWLHTNIPEIQHIEMLEDEEGEYITPVSTIDILGEKVSFTQIVEKKKDINGTPTPMRRVEIVL